jgi:hypothetical protein
VPGGACSIVQAREAGGGQKMRNRVPGFISCAPLDMANENNVYECWGEVNMVDLELEWLDRKHRRGERVWVIPPKRSRWSSVFANE